MAERKTGNRSQSLSGLPVSDRPHPYKTYLFFALTGSSILFLALSCIYVIWLTHNPPEVSINIPKPFIVSTILLLISSYSVSQTHKAFLDDNNPRLLGALSLTMFLGVAFGVFQMWGWKELIQDGFFINGEASVSFVYILSGLHLLHLAGGLLYLLYLNFKVFDNWNDPVRRLLYFTNHFELIRLDLISVYWHFIDVLWLVLFLTFLFTL
jgi:cytochrome c oxidase subunit III